MDLQHSLKESQVSLKHCQKQRDEFSNQLVSLQKEFSLKQQDFVLNRAGLS